MSEEDGAIAIKLYALRKENDGLLEALKCEQIERQKFIDENIKLKEELNNSITVKKIEEMLDKMIRQYEKYEYLGDTKRNRAYDICIGMVEQLIKENTESEE